jgi:hypothetical protein
MSAANRSKNRQEQLLLAAEVVVDAADAGAGVVGDIGRRGGAESVRREHLGGRIEDALLCRIGLRPAPCRRPSRHETC